MSQTITLYVDGACRGNPGLGGWGAYIITQTQKHELCGGEHDTTNNRMELTAAIEGIKFCDPQDKLIIWTDSTYVKRGITEWIEGWKKKNWKAVKNPDLWKSLDAICQGREIEWNWVKGHAGDPGNEKADQLANLGADQVASGIQQPTTQLTSMQNPSLDSTKAEVPKKKAELDWLIHDPFGLDLDIDASDDADAFDDAQPETTATLEIQPQSQAKPQTQAQADTLAAAQLNPAAANTNTVPVPESSDHPHIKITPATLDLQGPRQLILDTETTGFYFQDSDRIVEVGAIEMINRKLTGRSIHIYINPEKPVGDSADIHGITDEFLADKPKYAEIAEVLFNYLKGAEIIAHNATFDMNFLNMEFKRSGHGLLSDVCSVTDTLAMAKEKHPGQKNSLDALVRRYDIQQRDRTFHGALLDAEILADVYLAMTGGQVSFDMDSHEDDLDHNTQLEHSIEANVPVIYASASELEAHQQWMDQFQEKNGTAALFAQYEQAAQ